MHVCRGMYQRCCVPDPESLNHEKLSQDGITEQTEGQRPWGYTWTPTSVSSSRGKSCPMGDRACSPALHPCPSQQQGPTELSSPSQ